jgi:Transposase DDE domain group 1
LTRAWAAGAGPGDGPLLMDADSTICEVYGKTKQGATYGYTRKLGYHPLLATRADTGEVLHARQRAGKANTARGAPRFVDELIGRVRRAGAAGELIFRADSGFWSAKVIARLRAHDSRFSITVRQTRPVRAAIAAIPEAAWVDIAYPDSGVAQVAETPFLGDRLIVRRVRHHTDQGQLFATWDYHALVTDRPGIMTELDADHRRHAVVELAIRDAKSGAGLNHHPSSRFFANAAWLVLVCLAHTCCAGPPPWGSAPATARCRQDPAPHLDRLAWPAHPLRAPVDVAPAHRLAVGALVHDGPRPVAPPAAPRRLTSPNPSRAQLQASPGPRQPARTQHSTGPETSPARRHHQYSMLRRPATAPRPHHGVSRARAGLQPASINPPSWIQAEASLGVARPGLDAELVALRVTHDRDVVIALHDRGAQPHQPIDLLVHAG